MEMTPGERITREAQRVAAELYPAELAEEFRSALDPRYPGVVVQVVADLDDFSYRATVEWRIYGKILGAQLIIRYEDLDRGATTDYFVERIHRFLRQGEQEELRKDPNLYAHEPIIYNQYAEQMRQAMMNTTDAMLAFGQVASGGSHLGRRQGAEERALQAQKEMEAEKEAERAAIESIKKAMKPGA